MRDAYDSATAATAKKKLMQLVSWLDANGEEGAAASLREGLDETLTVMRLNLPAALRRTFATTNPIEMSSIPGKRGFLTGGAWKWAARPAVGHDREAAEKGRGPRRVHLPALG